MSGVSGSNDFSVVEWTDEVTNLMVRSLLFVRSVDSTLQFPGGVELLLHFILLWASPSMPPRTLATSYQLHTFDTSLKS
jgi:hypothetical protein